MTGSSSLRCSCAQHFGIQLIATRAWVAGLGERAYQGLYSLVSVALRVVDHRVRHSRRRCSG